MMMRFLFKYWQRIKGLFNLYKVGIYITDEALYFIEIERDILGYKVKNIDVEWFMPSEKLSEPLKRLVGRYPHIQDHVIYSNVSEKSTISEFFSLPKMNKEELSKGIHLEVARHLPYNAQTMEFAYQVLGENGGQYTLLAVIAKHAQIQDIWDAFRDAHLKLKQLSISNYSFINALKTTRNRTTAYLYPEPQSCTINIFDNGMLIFSYTSYAKNLINQLKDIDHALAQFTRSKDISKRFSTLKFIGDLGSFPETEKTRFLKYFVGIEQEEKYVFPAKSVEKFFVELPAMVGLVLNRVIKINLLPPQLIAETKQFLWRRKRWFAVFIAQVLLFTLSLHSFVNYTILNLEDDILLNTALDQSKQPQIQLRPGSLAALTNKKILRKKKLDGENKKDIYKQQIEYVDQLIKKIDQSQKLLNIYRQADLMRSDISFILFQLAEKIPDNVHLVKGRFQKNKQFYLEGWAKDQKAFQSFMDQLKNIGPGPGEISVSLLREKKEQLFFVVKGNWNWK